MKLLWDTTFWKEVVNLIAFLWSSFEIWRRIWLAFLWTSTRDCPESQKHTVTHINRWRSELPEGLYHRHLKESASHHVPHWLRIRPKIPKIVNLDNCETALVYNILKGSCQSDCIPSENDQNAKDRQLRRLCETALVQYVWNEVVNPIAILGSSFEIWNGVDPFFFELLF